MDTPNEEVKQDRFQLVEVAKTTELAVQDNEKNIYLKDTAVLTEILNILHRIEKAVVG